MKLLKYLWFTILIISTGCVSLQVNPPLPSPYPLRIGISPSLRGLYQEDLYRCASNNPDFVLVLNSTPSRKLDLDSSDIMIQLGEPITDSSFYAVQIGWEEIVLITSSDMDANNLTLDIVKEEFTALKPQYSVWTYPKYHEMERFFSDLILRNKDKSPYSQLVPGPEIMVEIINQTEKAIGYTLKSYLDSDAEIIPLDAELQESLNQPVLLIIKSEPEGAIKNFVSCVQGNLSG